MSVDLAHPVVEKIVLVLEGIGDDKIRVNSSSLDHPLVVLPEQALEIVAIAKKVMSMSVDLAHPAAEKIVLVLEGIGDDKIRVNSSSLDHPLVVLPEQALEIVAIAKKVMVGRVKRSAYWLNHDPSGLVEAGYGPTTK